MARPTSKQFGLDVNVLIDRAEEEPSAVSYFKVFKRQGFSFFLPPTAAIELEYLASADFEPSKQGPALIALESLHLWGIVPFNILPHEHGLAEGFARDLIRAGYVPEDEFHDGLILAETAIRQIPYLITSDSHLTDIDRKTLIGKLRAKDLFPTLPLKPDTALRLFG